jgi:hypothetical protein
MLAELTRVLDAVPPGAGRSGYATAIIEEQRHLETDGGDPQVDQPAAR